MTDRLEAHFDLASARVLATHLQTGEQWAAFRAITSQHEAKRANENRLFASEYTTRVEVRLKLLIDEKAKVAPAPRPRWAALDQFQPEALKRQAARDVRFAHESRLAGIDRQEAEAIRKLVRSSAEERVLNNHTQRQSQKQRQRPRQSSSQ